MVKICFLATTLLVSSFGVSATTVFNESFTTFTGDGLSPGGGNGTLDSQQWQIFGASQGNSDPGEHSLHGDFARGITVGGVRSGGIYAVLLPDDKRGLGVQATSADFTPGALLWTLTNLTDRWLNHLLLSFDLWWLNDGNRSTTIDTLFSSDGSTWDLLNREQTPSTADNLGWQSLTPSVQLGPSSGRAAAPADPLHTQHAGLAPGSSFWLRWQFDDHTGSGSRDEIAFTSLQIQAPRAPSSVNEPPTLWPTALSGALLILVHGARKRGSRGRARRALPRSI